MSALALVNARVLLDDGVADDRAVVIDGARIAAVVARDDPSLRGVAARDLGGALLLPGFVDVQVNGGGGVLFNAAPTVETIATVGRAHRRFGTCGFLPTLISDDLSVVERAIDAVRDAIAARVPGVLGIHIEGPFLSAARKGAHDAAKFRDLTSRFVALLAKLDNGRTLVTLAPERATPETIAELAAAGVVISAGHTDASCGEIQDALRAGVTGFTHLFNAMRPLGSREPGVVGAALDDPDSWCGIIVDGAHVHPVVLRIALRSKRRDRFMLVTDAMPPVGAAGASFELQGRTIRVENGTCVDEHGTLTGSALDMASAVRNTTRTLGVPLADAVRMASTYPAEFLGLGAEIGRIAAGYRANLVAADDELVVRETWIDGATA
jgi:N-acetylglucosamine-6-phosphate deacetylase